MASTGTRLIPVVLIWASLSAWGQQTPRLALPEWLAAFPQARDVSEAGSSYTALAHPAAVVSYYEQELKNARIAFKTRNDGIGISIETSTEKDSAIVRIREDGDVSIVKVSYALTPAANPQPQPAVGSQAVVPASPSKREPTSPYARSPYIWAMQSVIVRASNRRKYSAMYYEAPTDRSVEKPLTVPAGATIVDVFPEDCQFSFQDQDGHFLTFNKKEEALGKRLAPGTWAVYPMNCTGIDVFLH